MKQLVSHHHHSELLPSEVTAIYQLWNQEFPEPIIHLTIKDFQDFLQSVPNKKHYLIKDYGKVIAWAFVFDREGENWFSLLVDPTCQKQGFGRKLLNEMKADFQVLSGWVITDHHYLKSDKSNYQPPVEFYVKNGFTLAQQPTPGPKIVATKIQWFKDKYAITINTWNKLATPYQQLFMDLSLYNESYNVFLSLLTEKDASILELGCGPGNITRYLLNKQPTLQILATDVSPNMVEAASKNVPGATFSVLDVRQLGQLNNSFNAIVCGFCLPYLDITDFHQLVKNCKDRLLPNGLLYLSTIEGNYTLSGLETNSLGDKSFVHYYQPSDLEEAFMQQDLSVQAFFRTNYKKGNGDLQYHLIYIVKKHA